MKRLLKSQLALMLVLSLLVGMGTMIHAEEAVVPVLTSIAPLDSEREVEELLSYYETAEISTDWEEIIAKYAAGYEFEMGYLDNLEWDGDTFSEQSPSFYGSRMMALVAIGVDPRDYFEKDLTGELLALMDENGSFGTTADQVYAMLALNVFETEYEEDKAVASLLAMQNEDGGFGYAPGTSDLDTTGTVLIALGQYKENETVMAAIDKAVMTYIKPQQLATGGFPSWGSENSNTVARVMTGLVGAGYDVYDDTFMVDGKSMVDALSAYELEDHSYTWQLDPAEFNGFSTKQVLMGYADVMNGRTAFDMLKNMNKTMTVGVRIEGTTASALDVVESIEYFGYGVSTKEVIELVLDANALPYVMESSQYGHYISSINNETAGTFGGYDGWMYLINGVSGMGIDNDRISDGDRIVLYYGEMAPTTLIPTVLADSLVLAPFEPLRIHVTSTYDVYDANWNATATTVNVEGATVMIGDTAYLTDGKGYVVVPQEEVPFDQSVVIKVSKENEGAVASLVRTEAILARILFDSDRVYNDDAMISGWASESVYEARDKEIMLGSANFFSPKNTLSKAELSTLIVRMTGHEIADYGSDFTDVLSSSWYYTYISTGEHFKVLEADDKFFSPGSLVSRAEFAEMLAYAFDLETEETGDFTDLEGLDETLVAAITAVDAAGLLVGDGENFMPDMVVTREMAAVVMMRLDAME